MRQARGDQRHRREGAGRRRAALPDAPAPPQLGQATGRRRGERELEVLRRQVERRGDPLRPRAGHGPDAALRGRNDPPAERRQGGGEGRGLLLKRAVRVAHGVESPPTAVPREARREAARPLGDPPRSPVRSQGSEVRRPMTRAAMPAVLLWLFTLARAAGSHGTEMPEAIAYTLRFPAPDTHYVEVEAELPTSGRQAIELMMAVWTPGSYMVREFARQVEGITATAPDGRPLAIEKVRKNRWRVETGGAPRAVVRYRLYAREMSVRTNFVDAGFAILNGAPTFVTLVDGHRPAAQGAARAAGRLAGGGHHPAAAGRRPARLPGGELRRPGGRADLPRQPRPRRVHGGRQAAPRRHRGGRRAVGHGARRGRPRAAGARPPRALGLPSLRALRLLQPADRGERRPRAPGLDGADEQPLPHRAPATAISTGSASRATSCSTPGTSSACARQR